MVQQLTVQTLTVVLMSQMSYQSVMILVSSIAQEVASVMPELEVLLQISVVVLVYLVIPTTVG